MVSMATFPELGSTLLLLLLLSTCLSIRVAQGIAGIQVNKFVNRNWAFFRYAGLRYANAKCKAKCCNFS
jgi:hypothetical protein